MATDVSMGWLAQQMGQRAGQPARRRDRRRWLRIALLGIVATGCLGSSVRLEAAVEPKESLLNTAALVQLEEQADHADPREQCYLYTEVLHHLTELAGRQIAAGEDDAAHATMLRVDATAKKIRQSAVADARRLKNAELLMEHTQHRLTDMVRVASSDERAAMQTTLQHLTSLHDQMLAMVFAH